MTRKESFSFLRSLFVGERRTLLVWAIFNIVIFAAFLSVELVYSSDLLTAVAAGELVIFLFKQGSIYRMLVNGLMSRGHESATAGVGFGRQRRGLRRVDAMKRRPLAQVTGIVLFTLNASFGVWAVGKIETQSVLYSISAVIIVAISMLFAMEIAARISWRVHDRIVSRLS